MGIRQTLKMAVSSMMANKVRTFLTMLGVIIGVATFITLVALGEGTKKTINDRIQSLGTNLITINITGRNSNRAVTYDQLSDFAEKNSDDIYAISPLVSGTVKCKVGSKSWETSLNGTNGEYEEVRNTHVKSGRFISQVDVDFRQQIVVVGTAVVKNLFSANSNPVGEGIRINGKKFKIVGILEELNGAENYGSDDKVFVPITVSQRLMKSSQIRTFFVQASDIDKVDSALQKLQSLMLKTYKDEKTFRVMSQAEMLSQVDSVTGVMTAFLAFIAGISLFVGGIGIMNIMLVSVTERTREIGIRKAIGAKRKHVLSQFLIESVIISCLGGAIGIGLGYLAVEIIPKFTTMAPFITTWSVITSFVVSAIVGVFFGMYPASKASKLNPIEALRFE